MTLVIIPEASLRTAGRLSGREKFAGAMALFGGRKWDGLSNSRHGFKWAISPLLLCFRSFLKKSTSPRPNKKPPSASRRACTVRRLVSHGLEFGRVPGEVRRRPPGLWKRDVRFRWPGCDQRICCKRRFRLPRRAVSEVRLRLSTRRQLVRTLSAQRRDPTLDRRPVADHLRDRAARISFLHTLKGKGTGRLTF